MEKGRIVIFLVGVFLLAGFFFITSTNIASAGDSNPGSDNPPANVEKKNCESEFELVDCSSDKECEEKCMDGFDYQAIKNMPDKAYKKLGCYEPFTCEFISAPGENLARKCGRRRFKCPDPLKCISPDPTDPSRIPSCLCEYGPQFTSNRLQGCCDKGQKAWFGLWSYSEYGERKTTICCPSNDIEKTEKIWTSENADIFGMAPIKCCNPEDSVFTQYKLNEDVSEIVLIGDKCCPPDKGIDFLKESCVNNCCDDNKDCSSVCLKEDGLPFIFSLTCYKQRDNSKGTCTAERSFDKLKRGLLRQVCKEETIQPTSENQLDCGEKREAYFTCTDTSCRSEYCTQTEIETENGEEHRDIIAKERCDQVKKECVSTSSDGTPMIREVCEKDEVCLESNIVFYPQTENDEAVTLKKAECRMCPSEMSFGGPRALNYLVDGMEIKSGSDSYMASNVHFMENLQEALKRLNEICGRCKPLGKKLDFVSFHGHLASDADYSGISIANYPNLQGCIEKAIVSDCGFGSSKNEEEGKTLANVLGAPVIAGIDDTTGSNNQITGGACGFGFQQINNPNIFYPTDTITTTPHTIYYLSDINSFYPGLSEETYQIKVLEGNVGPVRIKINSNIIEKPAFVSMNEETMPCDYASAYKEEFEIDSATGIINFQSFSLEVLPETFSGSEKANISIARLAIDCSDYAKYYPTKRIPPSQSEMFNITALFNEGIIDKAFYDDFKYRYDNQLECTRDEHCVGLRCTMANLNCTYSCSSDGACLRGDELLSNRQIITLSRLVSYISQWVNGELSLSDLKDKINLWITGESESSATGSTTGSTNTEETRPTNKPSTGLIAYYTFDNDTTTKVFDVSGMVNDGSVVSNAGSVIYTDGISGSAVSFTGSGQISIPHSDAFNFGTGEFTMLAWVKISPAVDEAPRHIFGKRDTTGSGNWARLFTRDNGKIVFEFTNGDSLPSTFSYADDTWHFIAMSRNANGEVLFAVNNKTFTQTFTQDTTNTGDFTLGKWFSEEGFIGEVDEVRVYNKALTQVEILEKYNAER